MVEERTVSGGQRVVAFGAPGSRMLGMYHFPEPGTPARELGVVLCPPLGWEMIASYGSFRHLADLLRSRGFHVLRFDYVGGGDSCGDETDPGRVQTWLASIGHAIEELKRRSSVKEVALVGARLGATLAGLYAASPELPAPAALVLWSPFLTGRGFLREARAYQALNDQRDVGVITTEGDMAGFVLTPETTAALGEIDLLKRDRYRARAALLLARDEHSPEQKLADVLTRAGIGNELARIPGILPMLQEPRKSVVPTDVFRHIADWLEKTSPPVGLNPAVEHDNAPAELQFNGFREEAMFFGTDARLFGIAAVPQVPSRDRPFVIWLNTANDHRIGPHRSYVPLARSLAALGYSSFRFDPRGVGDGAPAPGAHAYSPERHVDVKEALDFVQRRYGIDKVVLVGLCSGAYMAFHFGAKDPRVVGEILVNPQTFEWNEGDSFDITTRTYRSTRAYKEMLQNPRTWMRALRGEVRAGAIALAIVKRGVDRGWALATGLVPALAGRKLNVKRTIRSKLRRGVEILFVLAENDSGLDVVEVHLGHRGRALRSSPSFTFEIVPGVDHTFSQRWAKDQLAALVIRHLTRHFQ